MPPEMLIYIGSHLKWNDFLSLRSTAKFMHTTLDYTFVTHVSNRVRIEPRYESMTACISFITTRSATMLSLVKRVTIVGEALGVHECGYQWGWEFLAMEMGESPKFSLKDQEIMYEVNTMHNYHFWQDQHFIATGRYRHMLTYILSSLPNLSEIVVGKLKPGEHIRGWQGEEMMKRLSFYGRQGFDANLIFYSNWMYDEKHHVVNSLIDEMTGCRVQPEDAGPQATFIQDLDAAMFAARLHPDIIRMHGYSRSDRLPRWYRKLSQRVCECRFTDPVYRFQLTLADKNCSFCDEPYGIDDDPFYNLDAKVFTYKTGYLPNRIY
jgi:hypothetical protein